MRWNYLPVPKLQWLYRWSLGMDKQYHPTLYNGCNYLSMLGSKLIHVSKMGPRPPFTMETYTRGLLAYIASLKYYGNIHSRNMSANKSLLRKQGNVYRNKMHTSRKLLDFYWTGGPVNMWKIQLLLVFQKFYRNQFFPTLDFPWRGSQQQLFYLTVGPQQ